MYSRREYLKKLQTTYLKAVKTEKTKILDEYIKNTGHNRKYVINQLNKVNLSKISTTGIKQRKSCYGPDIIAPLEKL